MKTLKSIVCLSLESCILCLKLNAQIVYTDIIPDTNMYIANTSNYDLDINNDGAYDYHFYYDGINDYCSSCVNPYYHNRKEVYNYIGNEILDSNNYPQKLTYNSIISVMSNTWETNTTQTLIFQTFTCSLYFCIASQSIGNWITATDNYLGLKLIANSNAYYGWVRISITNYQIIIKDYAYNSTPNQFILAGDTGTGPTGIIHSSVSLNNISFFPNPFTTSTTLTLNSQCTMHDAQLKIYDITGREVSKYEIRNEKTEVSSENLSSGIYFYKVQNNNEIIGTGKLVMQ